MNVDALIRMVATGLRPTTSGDLTLLVRTALVEVLSGRPSPHLTDEARYSLESALSPLQPAQLDDLYQHILRRLITSSPEGVEIEQAPWVQRAAGAYFTDEQVVAYMVQRAQQYATRVRSVIDPACGSGAFLRGIASRFSSDPPRLVGVDMDPAALAVCAKLLPQAHLHYDDTLTGEIETGFDLCIGNPPYISSGLRGATVQDAGRVARLRHKFPQSGQYKLNTYPLFVERGLELVRPGGVVGLIIPDSFLTGRYFERLRHLLLEHSLLELTLVRGDFWRHGRVGQSVILFVRNAPPPVGHGVHVRICDTVEELACSGGSTLPLSEIVWGQRQRFRLVPNGPDRQFLRQVESVSSAEPLSAWLLTYSGLIGRQGQGSLVFGAPGEAGGPWGRLLRSGREIDRYQKRWAGAWVCLQPELIKSGGRLEYYQSPKLLLRQTADSLRAVYDAEGYFCLNNIHLLVPRRVDTRLRYLLGLINSAVMNRYYRLLTMEEGRLHPQVDLDLLDDIPVPTVPASLADNLENLVWQRENAASPGETAFLDVSIEDEILRLYGMG